MVDAAGAASTAGTTVKQTTIPVRIEQSKSVEKSFFENWEKMYYPFQMFEREKEKIYRWKQAKPKL